MTRLRALCMIVLLVSFCEMPVVAKEHKGGPAGSRKAVPTQKDLQPASLQRPALIEQPLPLDLENLTATNDDCADAIPLFGDVQTLVFTTADATDDGPAPSCQGNTHKNVWYCWTAERGGSTQVGTCLTNWDTVVAVYDGCDCSNLVEIACSDDDCGSGAQSWLQFDSVAGHSYLISVGGWNTNAGIGLLSVTTTTPLMGACCLEGECAGTMPEPSCLNLGGRWTYTGDCDHFVCGECQGDLFEVFLSFDASPEETSWKLTEEVSGDLIGTGSGYTAETGYGVYNTFCLDPAGCYRFTIYDSAGNGMSGGSYTLIVNSEMLAEGGEFGGSETTRFGGACVFPTGACCVRGDCIGTTTQRDCELQTGTWLSGEDCATYVCPPSTADCSESAIGGQRLPLVGAALLTCDAAGSNSLLAENFSVSGGPIYGVDWWGAFASSSLEPCDTIDPTVQITFYEDAGGQPGSIACQYTVVPTWTPSGVFDSSAGIEVQRFSVDLLQPACNLMSGWISIQGVGTELGCRFWWAVSDEGNGSSFQLSPFAWPFHRDFSFCLDADYEPVLGACCDDLAGTCLDEVERIECFARFEAGVSCEDLTPPCGEVAGACCREDGTCEIVAESQCEGNWLGEDTTCDMCPCVVICPANAVAEEEDCGERTNDGCRMANPAFGSITPGVPVCGTVWASGGDRDTDWYEIVTTEDTRFTWFVEAEVESQPLLVGLIATDPMGTPDCSTATSFAGYSIGGACEPVGGETPCMEPGTYWFYVSVFGTEGLPCGTQNDYVALLTAEPCVITGACCHNDGNDCADNSEADCDAMGGEWFAYKSCEEQQCLIACPEAAIDIEIMTDSYPMETTWDVADSVTGDVIASGGPYGEAGHLYKERLCVPLDRCYTFTIYDEYNTGICCNYGAGYYNVFYQGTLVCSGGDFADKESCDIGVGCPERDAACCVAGECVGDMTNAACMALGGVWGFGASCAEGYDCTGEVDFRLTAPVINHANITCNAGDDCGLSLSQDHEYVVTVPEDGIWAFSLCGSFELFDTMLYVGTSQCSGDVGVNNDFCALASQVTAEIPAGDYYVTIEGMSPEDCGSYVLNVVKLDACDGECPLGATHEGEPDCGLGYTDNTNGGCDGFPNVFLPITANETVCGISGAYSSAGEIVRDSDWYEIEIPAASSLKWDVCATFDVEVNIWMTRTGSCDDAYPLATATGSAKIPTTAGAEAVPGLYWVSIAPVLGVEVPCGSTYVATITVEDAPTAGACCYAGGCVSLVSQIDCYSYFSPGTWYPGETCEENGGSFVCPAGGACCDFGGFCMTMASEFECVEYVGGTWFEGETCIEDGGSFVCPGGPVISACCMPDGACMMVGDEFECVALLEGTWHEGETCIADGGSFTCPGGLEYSACCMFDGFCLMLADEFECTDLYEGTWHQGELCAENGGGFVCPTSGAGWCDIDGNDTVDYDDYVIFLAAFGGPVDGIPPEDAACDFDNSGAVGLADYNAWLQCYRDFVGDPFAGPPSAPSEPTPSISGQNNLPKKKQRLPATEPAIGASQPQPPIGAVGPKTELKRKTR